MVSVCNRRPENWHECAIDIAASPLTCDQSPKVPEVYQTPTVPSTTFGSGRGYSAGQLQPRHHPSSDVRLTSRMSCQPSISPARRAWLMLSLIHISEPTRPY